MWIDLVDPGLPERLWEAATFEACGPSPHLSWERELDCHDGTPYPAEWRIARAVPLAIEFEWIRAACGGEPLPVGSGFRTWQWNTRSKGARRSTHPEGIALDIHPPGFMDLPDLVDVVIEVAHRPGSRIRGIGVYRTFVHFDIRTGTRIARWRGSRALPEVWRRVSRI